MNRQSKRLPIFLDAKFRSLNSIKLNLYLYNFFYLTIKNGVTYFFEGGSVTIKLEKIDYYRPQRFGIVKRPVESDETKIIHKIGLEINNIKSQTEAIKKGQINKPVATDSEFYLKKLRVI